MKMNKPMKELVSIVIPVYGVEKYLDRCVSSVVAQTYSNLEIILVDDGSPDRCPEMCDRWARKDSRIRVIHKENAGAGVARNMGLERATGRYICFVDSDDFIESDTIEIAVKAATRNCADVVMYGMHDIDETERILKTFVPTENELCIRGDAVQSEFLPDLIDSKHQNAIHRQLILSLWCCLFDMDLLKRANWHIASERQLFSEDSYSLIWLYRYVQAVVLLPVAKYHYLNNSISLSRLYNPERLAKIRHFYQSTMEMAKAQRYTDTVLVRIKGLYLSFIIAAIKQTVAADLKWSQKRKSIATLLREPLLREVLQDPACRYRNRTRRLMLAAMRSGWAEPVMLLAVLQNKKRK